MSDVARSAHSTVTLAEVSVAAHIDPVYAETLTAAIAAGVEVIVWQADMAHNCISLQRPLQLAL